MGWRIIYIEKSDYLNSYLDNLKIKTGNEETTIPFSDIDTIVIDNRYLNLSVGFINKCVDYKINVIFCDYYHLPSSSILSINGSYRTSMMLFKQIKWDDNQKAIIWQKIIKSKLSNQLYNLEIENKDKYTIEILKEYINQVSLYDETNREGLGAKIYFRSLFGKDFNREKDCIINSCLNYGYSIIRSQICRSIISKGLNPNLGIFHKGPINSFNLADDFIEVFRPIVDLWVYRNIKENTLFDLETKQKIVLLTTKKIKYENNVTLINSINIYIDKIINYFETGDLTQLTFPSSIYYE